MLFLETALIKVPSRKKKKNDDFFVIFGEEGFLLLGT
jgi:hypothetical protein